MKKRRIAIAFMLTAVLAAAMLLASCGGGGEDEAGAGAEAIKVIYAGYGKELVSMVPEGKDEEIECREYGILVENTSGEDFQRADVTIKGLDENGEVLKKTDGSRSQTSRLGGLKPGERAWIYLLEGEWETSPASFSATEEGIVWGNVNSGPLTVTASETVSRNDYASVYALTIRNDGEEDFIMVNDWSDANTNPGRQFSIVGADKDADGNIVYAKPLMPINDNEMGDVLTEDITFPPGEEVRILVLDNNDLEDPELMLCWY